MKTVMKFAIVVIASIMMLGCTTNERAKHFGGSMTIKLDRGQKLVDVTWKENSLWYMTKPMKEDDEAETYTFKEDSSYGIMQGTVIFVETK
jgi:uncharacterized lipoprotein YehR (DUF1307 family)